MSGYYQDGTRQSDFDRYWSTLDDDPETLRCSGCGFIDCHCDPNEDEDSEEEGVAA